jgi:hypothetical protein
VWLKRKIRLQQRIEVLNTADELSAAIKDISINEATRMFLYNQIISRTYNPKASRTYTVLFHNLPAKFKMAAFKHQVLQPINL